MAAVSGGFITVSQMSHEVHLGFNVISGLFTRHMWQKPRVCLRCSVWLFISAHQFYLLTGSQIASLVLSIVLSKDKSSILSPESLAFCCKKESNSDVVLPQWDTIMLLRILSPPAAVVYLLHNAPENVSLQHWSNSCRQGSPSQEKRRSQNITDTKGTASFLYPPTCICYLSVISAAAPMFALFIYYILTPKVLILLAD